MAAAGEALAFFAPHIEVLRFPAWDCLPYDRVSPNPEMVSERIATLAGCWSRRGRPRLVLTTVNALVQRVPPQSAFHGAPSMVLRSRRHAPPEAIIALFMEATATARPAP